MTTIALMFLSVSQTFSLPIGLLSAECWVESRHNPVAVNQFDGGSASLGVCQIKVSTARSLGYKGTETQLMSPKTNIYWAGKFLRFQLDRYHGDIRKAVAAYNAGKHRENEKGLTMNRKYVSKVFHAWSLDK